MYPYFARDVFWVSLSMLRNRILFLHIVAYWLSSFCTFLPHGNSDTCILTELCIHRCAPWCLRFLPHLQCNLAVQARTWARKLPPLVVTIRSCERQCIVYPCRSMYGVDETSLWTWASWVCSTSQHHGFHGWVPHYRMNISMISHELCNGSMPKHIAIETRAPALHSNERGKVIGGICIVSRKVVCCNYWLVTSSKNMLACFVGRCFYFSQ